MYFDFLLEFQRGVESFKSISNQEDSYLNEWIHHGMSLEKNLNSIL